MADSEWAGGNKAGKESGKKESRRDVVIRNIYEVVPVFCLSLGRTEGDSTLSGMEGLSKKIHDAKRRAQSYIHDRRDVSTLLQRR